MRRILTPALAAAVLAAGALGAMAQSDAGSPPERPGDRPGMMHSEGRNADDDGSSMRGDGPKGRHGMKMDGPHGRRGHDGPPPVMMKMMFAIADADGNGEVSLEEMQEIHARMFRAVDADGNGGVTQEEIRTFMRPERMGPPEAPSQE